MAKREFVSYLRCSTARQGTSGLGLEAQRAAVAGFLNGGDLTLVQEVLEVESGKRNDRPALATALKLCRKHRATLVIAKLDRLARNVALISNLMESEVEFVAVDMPQANRFVVHILAAVAEQEADAISKRTKAALAAAKARGTKLGGRRVSAAHFAEIGAAARQVRSQNASKIRSELLPTITAIQATGANSLRAIAAELNAREIPTPRRLGEWSAVQVKRGWSDRERTQGAGFLRMPFADLYVQSYFEVHPMRPYVRRLGAFVTLTLILCTSCKSHQKPQARLSKLQRFFGDGWLAWSPAERTEFVETYIDASSVASRNACQRAEDIFIEKQSVRRVPIAKLPYEKGDENSTDIPLTHCLNGQPKYSLGQRDEDGVMTSPYAGIITEMYEKHPDARSAPYFLLITLLSDGNAQTPEDLYKDQLGKWPNARYDPSFSSAH